MTVQTLGDQTPKISESITTLYPVPLSGYKSCLRFRWDLVRLTEVVPTPNSARSNCSGGEGSPKRHFGSNSWCPSLLSWNSFLRLPGLYPRTVDRITVPLSSFSTFYRTHPLSPPCSESTVRRKVKTRFKTGSDVSTCLPPVESLTQ